MAKQGGGNRNVKNARNAKIAKGRNRNNIKSIKFATRKNRLFKAKGVKKVFKKQLGTNILDARQKIIQKKRKTVVAREKVVNTQGARSKIDKIRNGIRSTHSGGNVKVIGSSHGILTQTKTKVVGHRTVVSNLQPPVTQDHVKLKGDILDRQLEGGIPDQQMVDVIPDRQQAAEILEGVPALAAYTASGGSPPSKLPTAPDSPGPSTSSGPMSTPLTEADRCKIEELMRAELAAYDEKGEFIEKMQEKMREYQDRMHELQKQLSDLEKERKICLENEKKYARLEKYLALN